LFISKSSLGTYHPGKIQNEIMNNSTGINYVN